MNNGIHFQTAGKYGREVDKYLEWLKENNLTPAKVKASQFTDYLMYCKKQGNTKRTRDAKQSIITHYYNFLGTKRNPAKNWIPRRSVHKLPPKPIEKEQLAQMYQNLKPASPAEYRNRCMMGLILFQGLMRSELTELRLSDFDFDKSGTVFVQGQARSRSRTLKLEPIQMMHLYDYVSKYRNEFLQYRTQETDKVFLSRGNGNRLDNAIALLWNEIKSQYPQIQNLGHIRGSVISHWDKEEGIMEAMEKAGMLYVSSVRRYQTDKLEELQKELIALHPLEHLDIGF
jgi:integrase/recombinase XerD